MVSETAAAIIIFSVTVIALLLVFFNSGKDVHPHDIYKYTDEHTDEQKIIQTSPKIKGDLVGGLQPLTEKEEYAKQQGMRVCAYCESFVPLTQSTCFICNNTSTKRVR